MSGLSTNQINHYNEKGYVSPLEALSTSEANDVKDEIEYIEKKWPEELTGLGRNYPHLISPIFDLSSKRASFMENCNSSLNPNYNYNPMLVPQQQRNMLSGNKPVKRSVSETKKKYVASMQDWKCGQCKHKLTHTFEIDHKIRLEHGGGNDVTNLVALCRECHGQKTAMENM